MGLAVAAGAARLAWAALLPLFPDETYYWEWSRHPAWGYFDHPPAVAWLIRGGTLLVGDRPLGVRLLPVVAGVVGVLASVATARRLGGGGAALRASAVLACLPLAAAGLLLATPDAPLLSATAVWLYGTVRALEADRHATGWWALAGCAAGAALLAKYTAVLLPAATVLALVVDPRLRPHLRRPGPYLAAGLAITAFLPVIGWNADHGWASFRFQLGHGLAPAGGSVFAREAELLGGQAAVASPILFALMVWAVTRRLPTRNRASRRVAPAPHGAETLLAVCATVFLGVFAVTATRHRVEPNWPALFYVPATVLLALQPGGFARRWMRPGLAVGAAMVGLIYADGLWPVLPVAPETDPIGRADGWAALAGAVRRSAGEAPGSTLAAVRYQDASELAFHLPGKPFVTVLPGVGRPTQYKFWDDPPPPLLVVAPCGVDGDPPDLGPGIRSRPAPEGHVRAVGPRGVIRERCLYRVTKRDYALFLLR